MRAQIVLESVAALILAVLLAFVLSGGCGCAVNFGSGSAGTTLDRSIEGTNRVTDLKMFPLP